MLRFKYVEMEGCFSWGPDIVRIPLDNQGVVLVTGTFRKGSNGAGKSSIFKAIMYCLYGTTPDGERGKAAVNKLLDSMRIEVGFSKDGIDYKATVAEAHPDIGSGYWLSAGSSDVSMKRSIDTRRLVQEKLGMGKDEFLGAVYLAQASRHPLVENSGAYAVQYLTDLFGLGVYDDMLGVVSDDLDDIDIGSLKAHESIMEDIELPTDEELEEVGTKLRRRKATLQKKRRILAGVSSSLSYAKVIIRDQQRLTTILEEAGAESLAEMRTERKKLVVRLKRLRGRIRTLDQSKHCIVKARTYQDQLDELPPAGNEVKPTIVRGWWGKVTLYNERLKTLKHVDGDDVACPTCEGALTKDHITELREVAHKRIRTYRRKIHVAEEAASVHGKRTRLENTMTELLDGIEDADDIIEKHRLCNKRLRTAERRKRLLDDLLDKAPSPPDEDNTVDESDIADLEEEKHTVAAALRKLESSVSKLEARLHTMERNAERHKELDVASTGVDDELVRHEVLSTMKRAISRGGVVRVSRLRMVVESMLSALPRYTSIMFPGNVRFEADADESKLAFYLVRGRSRVPVRTLSGGEKCRASICMQLAQRDLVRKIDTNLIILDEQIDGLDGIGKDAMMDLLAGFSPKGGTVLLTTHDKASLEGFWYDQVWTVRRRRHSEIAFKKASRGMKA